MFSIKDIKNAINGRVESNFPNINIQSRDVKEGFKRPSFFIRLDNILRDTSLYTSSREITCRILYFAKDRYDTAIENMEVLDKLEDIFALNFIVTTDTGNKKIITINDTRSQFIDDVLEFEFDFQFYEDNEVEEHGELMEELELRDNVRD